jgi:hypothetical protein
MPNDLLVSAISLTVQAAIFVPNRTASSPFGVG